MEVQKLIPKLRGLVDAKVEVEINLAFQRIYDYYDNEIKGLKNELKLASGKLQIIESSGLFAGALAVPLIQTDDIATAAQEGDLTPADIPNLDANKITTGIFPLARIPTNVLKTDDNLTKIVAAAPYANDGFITVKDNAGNSIKLGTVT